MKRSLIILFTALTLTMPLIVVSAAPVFAAVQGSCSVSDETKVLLYENESGDTSDGDDRLWKCGSDTDLGNDDHTLPGTCKSDGLGRTNWNDCVTSVRIYLPSSSWRLCLYGNAGYANQNISPTVITGPEAGVRYDLSPTDGLSSFKITTSTC